MPPFPDLAGRLAPAALALVAAALVLAGCASHPRLDPPPLPAAFTLPVDHDAVTGQPFLHLSVLSYNVAGLPWPRRANAGAAMERIAAAWPEEFAYGSPDVVILQEAFVPRATRMMGEVGYANLVRGPQRGARADPLIAPADRAFRKGRRLLRGERLGRRVNSGLLVATDLAVARVRVHPFGGHSCAGFDCLANKGVQLVEIDLPGVPEPLFVLNTHLNSRDSSGASAERSLYAYRRQLAQIEAFLDRAWQGRGPLIWAGDFNARHDPDRFAAKEEHIRGELAHRHCIRHPDLCVVTASWDNDEPWLDTQDLQGFVQGQRVNIEPVAIRARFDAPVNGRMLSDHDGLEVVWRLYWSASANATQSGL
ncbi:endonuclease/exonuclease/phosphatase family protein [Alteraurantiacibacter palmitatis]|uniref:Endonuclease/exonuclease/phosphatase family protein n=1 Tax=Alteraurantiacibacter palmitatis TaxID=2054628 RepID=A0ABV7E9E6_9SPHN